MRLAVVTAIYPAVTKFLEDFFFSLESQSDQEFDLWVALDGIDKKHVTPFYKNSENINFVVAPSKATPAIVRNNVLKKALQESNAVALVDADDILGTKRVENAKTTIKKCDVAAVGMNYIDEKGKMLEGFFNPSFGDRSLVCNNIFGFSNTTWKSNILNQFLPVPKHCVLMDWYVATLALYTGASMGYDKAPRMQYRQHPKNIAASRKPFNTVQIEKAAILVLGHYDLILDSFAHRQISHAKKFEDAKSYVLQFSKAIKVQKTLEKYIAALNTLPDKHVWWSCVAHPELEKIWKK